MEILKTQQILSDYINFKEDEKQFTKYVEELNGKTDKKDSK